MYRIRIKAPTKYIEHADGEKKRPHWGLTYDPGRVFMCCKCGGCCGRLLAL